MLQLVPFVQYLSVYMTHDFFLLVKSDGETKNCVVGTKPWTVTFCLHSQFSLCFFVFLLRKYFPCLYNQYNWSPACFLWNKDILSVGRAGLKVLNEGF